MKTAPSPTDPSNRDPSDVGRAGKSGEGAPEINERGQMLAEPKGKCSTSGWPLELVSQLG